jgi:DeoR family suf operon transcriptional repressor
VHHATTAAENLFANPDSDVSVEILGLVEAEDPSLIGRLFERRRDRLVADAQSRLQGHPAEERVEIVVALLLDQGYLADGEQVSPGHHRINLRSCAIWGLASHFGQACTSELEFIRALIPDAIIERTSTKTDGDHTCSYDIRLGAS